MSLLAPALTVVGFDDSGVSVPPGTPSPLLLHVDGQYVWSFDVARDGHLTPSGRLVPWPLVLRPYLTGSAALRLETAAGDVVTDQEVTLGDGTGRISIRDRNGNPLAVDKVGHLGRVQRAARERGQQQHGREGRRQAGGAEPGALGHGRPREWMTAEDGRAPEERCRPGSWRA